jgi:hypothetical protein
MSLRIALAKSQGGAVGAEIAVCSAEATVQVGIQPHDVHADGPYGSKEHDNEEAEEGEAPNCGSSVVGIGLLPGRTRGCKPRLSISTVF